MRHAEALRYLILAAQREGNRWLARQLDQAGVTPSQAEVLRILLDRAGTTLRGLGELLVCESGHSPSRLVSGLVDAGLVDRTVPAANRRQVELSLTEAGQRTAREVAAIEETLYASIEASIGDHDVEAALALLRDMVAGSPAGEAWARRQLATPTPPASASASASAPTTPDHARDARSAR
ncbi:MAG: winged helix-turn-helix transcriptional regulator [Actinobacteria bacterium]|nr:winged helix-turn-helix transcriptional regulator [Actinomycetota bacterium]MBI3686541.1 winged helix-turn-helix transcriptional regulator [Actinomycetota bacterium]